MNLMFVWNFDGVTDLQNSYPIKFPFKLQNATICFNASWFRTQDQYKFWAADRPGKPRNRKEMERNLLAFFVLFLSFSASSCSAYFFGDADYLEALAIPPAGGARVYIVTVEWHKRLEPKQFAIKTLTSVLGRYALSFLF